MERLKNARKAKGFTQDKLASLVSVSRQAYSSYETGTRDPDTRTLSQIAINLDVSVDYLLGKVTQSQTESNRTGNLVLLLNPSRHADQLARFCHGQWYSTP